MENLEPGLSWPPWSYQNCIGFVLLEPNYDFVEEWEWWKQVRKSPGPMAYECVTTEVLAYSCMGPATLAFLICPGGKKDVPQCVCRGGGRWIDVVPIHELGVPCD